MEKRVLDLRNMYEDAEKAVRNRIKNVLKEKGLTENSVAAGDGAAQSRLNSQLKDGRITLNTILHILEACPDVSADWLLRGTGEMSATKITGANSVTGRNATVIGQQTAVSDNYVRELLAAKDAIIAEKEKRIAEKEEMIALLRNQK